MQPGEQLPMVGKASRHATLQPHPHFFHVEDGAAHGVARCTEASLQRGHGVDVHVGASAEGRRLRLRLASR